MNLFKKQSGFAPLIAILIVVVLIVAGGTSYYFYKTSVEKSEVPPEEITPPPKEEEAEIEMPEQVVAPKGEYAEVIWTSDQGEKKDFQAKTIFVSEIFENAPFPYVQIALFEESLIIAPFVLMDKLEEALSTIPLNEIINNIKMKEEQTGEAKGFAVIVIKKPEVGANKKVVCDLAEETRLQRDDSPCYISIGQVTGGEPVSISFGKATFYFKENDIIEGEYDAYFGGNPISGKLRIKIREGVTLIEKERLVEEAERQIKELKETKAQEKEISDRDRRRVNDITLIWETLQSYYRAERKYFQSKTMPTGIKYYLVPALKDPLTREPYHWLDNTPGALTGCDDQHFVFWAELEKDTTLYKFIVASEKGVTQLKTQPTKCPPK